MSNGERGGLSTAVAVAVVAGLFERPMRARGVPAWRVGEVLAAVRVRAVRMLEDVELPPVEALCYVAGAVTLAVTTALIDAGERAAVTSAIAEAGLADMRPLIREAAVIEAHGDDSGDALAATVRAVLNRWAGNGQEGAARTCVARIAAPPTTGERGYKPS